MVVTTVEGSFSNYVQNAYSFRVGTWYLYNITQCYSDKKSRAGRHKKSFLECGAAPDNKVTSKLPINFLTDSSDMLQIFYSI